MKIKKEQMQAAIQDACKTLFEDSGQITQSKLYLTQKQYDLDPEGWKKLLKQRGLPEDAIEIIPAVFDIR